MALTVAGHSYREIGALTGASYTNVKTDTNVNKRPAETAGPKCRLHVTVTPLSVGAGRDSEQDRPSS